MTTPEARLVRIEDGIREIREMLSGTGNDETYKRSIRGRMHVLWDEYQAREHIRRAGLSRFSRGEAVAFLAFGLIQTLLLVAVFVRTSGHG
jgi:hypothetical protein